MRRDVEDARRNRLLKSGFRRTVSGQKVRIGKELLYRVRLLSRAAKLHEIKFRQGARISHASTPRLRLSPFRRATRVLLLCGFAERGIGDYQRRAFARAR